MLMTVTFLYRYRAFLPDHIDGLTPYLLTIYDTWAYTRAFLTQAERADKPTEVAREMVIEYANAFTANHLLGMIRRHDRTEYTVKITGMIRADYIARAMLQDPRSPFTKVLQASVKFDATNYLETLTSHVKSKFEVFPHRRETTVKMLVHSHGSGRTDVALLPNGLNMTVENMRAVVRRARLDATVPTRLAENGKSSSSSSPKAKKKRGKIKAATITTTSTISAAPRAPRPNKKEQLPLLPTIIVLSSSDDDKAATTARATPRANRNEQLPPPPPPPPTIIIF